MPFKLIVVHLKKTFKTRKYITKDFSELANLILVMLISYCNGFPFKTTSTSKFSNF